MSRKLASVQRIKAIKPIEGADKIEIVQVLNWDCVAKKGEYQIGDIVIYFEIDSLLPDIPAFEWLKGSSWSQKLNKYKKSISNVRKNGCLDVLNEKYSNLLSERYEAYNLSNHNLDNEELLINLNLEKKN